MVQLETFISLFSESVWEYFNSIGLSVRRLERTFNKKEQYYLLRYFGSIKSAKKLIDIEHLKDKAKEYKYELEISFPTLINARRIEKLKKHDQFFDLYVTPL